ncbi:dTDP-4-dehydrorhamnose 3,5-epimerase [Sphingobacterium chungjuense]|uniref:dTDP-4-dehydrorhamnose 3,5-epimerase n=1 Tax=Sphingobacterium chungjuense TaxID=2675553 RepID=UPI00140E58BC|nr:dTDP-4-dehydrorhamnose 3,5-epimerase [Sphingobacterium chungjuense]
MKIIGTKLSGCYILEAKKFEDERGFFFESFNVRTFQELTKSDTCFVQDNQSFSKKGVVRGLHAQKDDHAQAKLVRVLEGTVLDVAVDMRENSATFGEHIAVELSSENGKQLFVPRGFLHGFAVLSDSATFFYKCDNYYHKDSEWGIRFDDSTLCIDWQMSSDRIIVSEKDLLLPTFKDLYKGE